MKKTNKIILVSIIFAIIISGFSIQNLFPITNLESDDTIKDNVNDDMAPNAAQEQVNYDWGGGRNMTIDADPPNNKTTTTINDGVNSYPIYSELNETQATTIFNNSAYFTMNDTKTTLYNDNTGNTAEIDHTFTDNSMDITVPGEYYIHTEAVGDYSDKSLESCNVDLYSLITQNKFNMDYEQDDIDGYDLFINLTDPISNVQSNFDYDDVNNEFRWSEATTFFGLGFYIARYQAIINNSGVWINGIQRVDWLDGKLDSWTQAGGWPNIVAINVTEVSINTVVISYMFHEPSGVLGGPIPRTPIYDLIFTKTDPTTITMELVLTTDVALSIVWYDNLLSVTSGVGEEAAFILFYLWYIASDKLYIVILADFEIEFHWFIILIYTKGVLIEIVYIEEVQVILFIIELLWIEWGIRIRILLDLNDVFFYYQITIRYWFWTYIYFVPTYTMPNMLFIKIIESSYGSITFDFTLEITDFWGNPVDGCQIFGDWDDYEIQPGDIFAVGAGSGQYELSLPAKRIAPGDPALWLNLTATKSEYANGTLNTQIAIYDQLFINIVNFECYNTTEDNWWFIFSVEITNSFGILTDPDTFSGFWDSKILTLENITDTGVGTYSINVTAVFVSAGDPGIDLDLTATKTGFGDGLLSTEIAVDPKIKDKVIEKQLPGPGGGIPPTGDDDNDDDEDEGIDINIPVVIGVGVISAIGAAGIAIYLLKRKR